MSPLIRKIEILNPFPLSVQPKSLNSRTEAGIDLSVAQYKPSMDGSVLFATTRTLQILP